MPHTHSLMYTNRPNSSMSEQLLIGKQPSVLMLSNWAVRFKSEFLHGRVPRRDHNLRSLGSSTHLRRVGWNYGSVNGHGPLIVYILYVSDAVPVDSGIQVNDEWIPLDKLKSLKSIVPVGYGFISLRLE